jgi:hypothetical protein
MYSFGRNRRPHIQKPVLYARHSDVMMASDRIVCELTGKGGDLKGQKGNKMLGHLVLTPPITVHVTITKLRRCCLTTLASVESRIVYKVLVKSSEYVATLRKR